MKIYLTDQVNTRNEKYFINEDLPQLVMVEAETRDYPFGNFRYWSEVQRREGYKGKSYTDFAKKVFEITSNERVISKANLAIEQLVTTELSKLKESTFDLSKNNKMFIRQLPEEQQIKVEKVIERNLRELEFTDEVLAAYLEDAMDSRLSDIEDTVDKKELQAIVSGEEYYLKIDYNCEVFDEYTFANLTITQLENGQQTGFTVWKDMSDPDEYPYIIVGEEVVLLDRIIGDDAVELLVTEEIELSFSDNSMNKELVDRIFDDGLKSDLSFTKNEEKEL